jgi:hypothetical protein
MSEQLTCILAEILFAIPFFILAVLFNIKMRQRRQRAAATQAHVPAAPAQEPVGRQPDSHDRHIQEIYPALNRVAGDFLRLLSDTDFKGDLTLAAEMAGLKMLRNSGADLGRRTPGHILLSAIPEEAYRQMERFLHSWCLVNAIPVETFRDVQLPPEDMEYAPQVVRLEPAFDSACRVHAVPPEDAAYAAALAALKLVAAGRNLQLMDSRVAQYMTYYHIIAASKTVPPADTVS